MSIPIGAILGPTAIGKSKVAVEVADLLEGEIVSVDSMQVYKGLDIGTAKIREEERFAKSGKYIEHHMIDIVTPDINYNVADFQREAVKIIKDIHSRGKLPMLVGGTGLYYNAVVYGYDFPRDSFDENLRLELIKEAEEKGNIHLYNKLIVVDPKAAEKIHPNDTKRIIRALEYFYLTGKRISDSAGKNKSCFRTVSVGLYMERRKLYSAIEKRVDKMIEEGLIEEVKDLVNKGYKTDSNWAQGLGYKQVLGFLAGNYDIHKCIELIKKETRNYAKRQITWFKRDKNIVWFNVEDYPNLQELAKAIATHICQRLQIKLN
ncbi:MAG: tRNA (adenosine(37)-N6)-dimethylallyltransferase MiaA [Clostridia bacterium]|nr:tRNA (adenosine(37)-N6)-dimethylallyltransferase MiaA [Clostridia bacterium]